MKRRILFLLLFFSPVLMNAQNCAFMLTGQIMDKGTGIPLPYSNVFLKDQAKGVISDSLGFFQITNLCAGDYHLEVSHIGCEPTLVFIEIAGDTSLQLLLNHHAELLDEVVVHGSREDNSSQVSSTIDREVIEQNSHKNLAEILESITGVSVLKNGSGMSKPIIHGLYGNRVAILNNGIEQSGQQWGNDHAPEIDPFFANHLSVIKGASALAYSSNALGSVVLVETNPVQKDPHLHGGLNYIFQSNGRGHTVNAQFEKNSPWAAWRVSGTLKLQGDTKTPDYFLTNTGKREGNFAFQLEKNFSEQWFNNFYFSSFNTEIGVLRGAHVGNLTDLQSALEREEPFFTQDSFSYAIEAPRQKVNHQLLKVESKYFFDDHQFLKFKYGGQLNDRKEFDVRRNGRSDIPSLSLQQYTHFVETAYQYTSGNHAILKAGLQYRFIDNGNDPETGVMPLIPNYDSHTASTFLIFQKEQSRLFYELGARYDFKNIKVKTISQTIPRFIERLNHQFHNYAFSSGLKYDIAQGLKVNLNAGYMLRAPEVNELYSFGLHQGVSGIEEGSRTLQVEKSFKGIAAIDWYFQQKLFVQALAYYQNIEDYIYLQPQDEFRLTIRGAFPLFIYEQTDARIQGLDFLLSFEPIPSTKWLFKYSHVDGRDLSNDLALINIPTDNLFSSLSFSLKDGKTLKQNTFSINSKYVFQQKGLLAEQDFQVAPEAYFLLGFKAATNWPLEEGSLRFSLSVENLLNTQYRDYLNRLRYFSDDTGINVTLNVKYGF